MERSRAVTAPVVSLMLAMVCSPAICQQAPASPSVLKGPTMGAVKFPHAAHIRVAGKCEICHHASKPEKPLKSQQEACADCHTKPPTPPVKIGLQAAFHNPSATAGLCITCHKTENLEGKTAPVKCVECHKTDFSQLLGANERLLSRYAPSRRRTGSPR